MILKKWIISTVLPALLCGIETNHWALTVGRAPNKTEPRSVILARAMPSEGTYEFLDIYGKLSIPSVHIPLTQDEILEDALKDAMKDHPPQFESGESLAVSPKRKKKKLVYVQASSPQIPNDSRASTQKPDQKEAVVQSVSNLRSIANIKEELLVADREKTSQQKVQLTEKATLVVAAEKSPEPETVPELAPDPAPLKVPEVVGVANPPEATLEQTAAPVAGEKKLDQPVKEPPAQAPASETVVEAVPDPTPKAADPDTHPAIEGESPATLVSVPVPVETAAQKFEAPHTPKKNSELDAAPLRAEVPVPPRKRIVFADPATLNVSHMDAVKEENELLEKSIQAVRERDREEKRRVQIQKDLEKLAIQSKRIPPQDERQRGSLPLSEPPKGSRDLGLTEGDSMEIQAGPRY